MSELISLMVVTFNRLSLTKRFYKGIIKTVPKFDLIIVDNYSTDGTVEWLKDLKPDGNVKNLIIRYNSENRGIAAGRNKCLKIALDNNSDWFGFLDNDVEMKEDNWLEQCIGIMKANPQYGGVGVNFENTQYPLVTKNGFTFQHKPHGNLGTAAAIVPRSIVKMVGYLKTDYPAFQYATDDADYFNRIAATGLFLAYLKIPGVHFGGENEEKNYRKWKDECHAKNLEEFKRNCALYYQRKKSIYLPYKD